MIKLLMDTMTTDKKRVRRSYSPALKAQILAECATPGASVAKVAMSHGINANVVHTWRRLAHVQADAGGAQTAVDAGVEFSEIRYWCQRKPLLYGNRPYFRDLRHSRAA